MGTGDTRGGPKLKPFSDGRTRVDASCFRLASCLRRAGSVFARYRGRVTLPHGRIPPLNPEYLACRALLVYKRRGRKLWHPKPASAHPLPGCSLPLAVQRARCFHGYLSAKQCPLSHSGNGCAGAGTGIRFKLITWLFICFQAQDGESPLWVTV